MYAGIVRLEATATMTGSRLNDDQSQDWVSHLAGQLVKLWRSSTGAHPGPGGGPRKGNKGLIAGFIKGNQWLISPS